MVRHTYAQGGRRDLEQVWRYVTPEAVAIDARADERQRPSIKGVDANDYKTPYGMWANVALPMNFVTKMFGDKGYLNERLSGASNKYNQRKTTIGEGIQFYGYMLGIANNPGQPVDGRCGRRRKNPERSALPRPRRMGALAWARTASRTSSPC